MADIWMPGVTRLGAGTHGWQLDGGTPKAVWHSTENNPETTAAAIGEYLIGMGYEPHLCWNPWTGEIVQLIPANIGGSALVTGNNSGSAVIQIECIGKANNLANSGPHNGQLVRPLTDSPLIGFGAILAWLDSFGISRNWPAGPPLASGYGPNPTRQVFGGNSPAGHYSHSQIPGNDHGDPGLVNVANFGGTFTPGGDPVMAVLEGLAFDGSHTFTHADLAKVEALQLFLAQAGVWIAPYEKSLVRPWAARYDNLRAVLGSFQAATKTGNPDGTPDYIVGPATAAALGKQTRVF